MSLNNLYDAFKPIFYLSVVFGTMPLYFSCKPFTHLKISKYRITYTSFWMLSILGHGIATPWFVIDTNSSPLNPVPITTNVSVYVDFIRNQTSAQIVTMKVVNPLINTFMCLGSLWVSLINVTTNLPIFVSHLADVDIKLLSLMKFRPRCNHFISLILTIYVIIISIPVYMFYLYAIYKQGTLGSQAWSTVLLFCIASSFSTEIQFLNWAFCLQVRFKIINNFLRKYNTQNQLFNTCFSNKGLYVKQRLTIRRIEIAHQCNKKLCDLIQDLNDIYQLQLLCTVAGCFIKILFNIYFALFASFINETKNSNIIQTSNTIMWTTFYFARFLVTTVIASNTSEEAYKTRSIVSSVNRRSYEREIKEELNIFLFHTSNQTLKFTACGLFTLNTRLITSAVAAGTTYLVILIQFRPQIN